MNSNTAVGSNPRTNYLLAALPDQTWTLWEQHLQCIELHCGRELGQAGAAPAWAVFPTSAIVSLMCMTHDGYTAEIGMVGNDGAIGLPLFQAESAMPSQPIVQTAGLAYRLRAQLVTDEIRRGGEVLNILLRYGQALLGQVSQTALCNRHHTIDQQVCRRLLLGFDRSPSGELAMTHAGIAQSLGCRREGVSAAAYKLQKAGVIQYGRGRIVLLDRRELERRACECYQVVRSEHAGPVTPGPGPARRTVPTALSDAHCYPDGHSRHSL